MTPSRLPEPARLSHHRAAARLHRRQARKAFRGAARAVHGHDTPHRVIRVFQAVWAEGSVEVSLRDPSGSVITPATPLAHVTYLAGPNSAAYQIDDPIPGLYTMTLRGSSPSVTGFAQALDVHPPLDAQVTMDTAPIALGTQVALSLGVTDVESMHGMTMRYRVDAGEWSAWQPFTPSLTIPVAADSVERVAVQFRDGAGNLSPIFSDGELIDADPPAGHRVYVPRVLRESP